MKTIEADLASKRDTLDQGLNQLRGKLEPEALLESGKEAANRHLVPLATGAGAAAARTVKAHPVALTLIGAGAAWLLWQNREKEPVKPLDDSALAGSKYEALSRWEDEGGPMPPEPEAVRELDPAEEEAWMAEADSLRDRARGLLAQIDKAARDKLVPAAELAKQRAAVLSALTTDVRATMAKGLEGLSEQARAATLTAREAAYTARVGATDVAQKGVTLAKENPLIVAALVGAAGVALAAAMPRNKHEQSKVGAWRDQLFSAVTSFAAAEIDKQIAQFSASLTQSVKPKDKEAGDAAPDRPHQGGTVSRL